MKQAPSYSRSELLAWINNTLSKQIETVRKIEELGNGAAYLLLLNHLKAGSVRPDRIIKNPVSSHEISSNLKLLNAAFDKLQLGYKIQIDKLAQMKYQDNFHLASFLYRIFKQTNPNKDPNPPNTQSEKNALKKIKFILPPQPPTVSYAKQLPSPITKQDFQQLQISSSHKKLKEIRTIVDQDAPNKQKLAKIANILQMRPKEKKVSPVPMSVQESYKILLRESLCKKSKYLPMFSNGSFLAANSDPNAEKTVALSEQEQMKLLVQKQKQNYEAEGEMLLSSHKKIEEPLKIHQVHPDTDTPSEITPLPHQTQQLNNQNEAQPHFQDI